MPDPLIVPYKTVNDVTLNMHIFKPAHPSACDPRPVIVLFSCGGWKGWNPAKFYPQCEYLASRGMVAVSVEVRVISRHGTTPVECVVDAKSAVRWTRAHAAELAIDPGRIVASGGSAGGHVACCTAVIDGFDEPHEGQSVSAKPNALVLFNPVVDLLWLQRRVDVLGGLERARELSPLHHVRPDLPPTVIFHGRDDAVVDVEQVIRFQRIMLELRNRCDLYVYPDQGHGFFNYFDGRNPMFTETMRQTDRFLTSLGYLLGEPTIDEFHRAAQT